LIGVTLANAVILARVLGPRGVGEFFLIAQVVAILAVVGEGGLSHSAAAFFGRNPLESRYMHGMMLRILSVSVTVTLVVAAAILTQLHDVILPDVRVELLWIAFATVPFAVYANVWIAMMAGLGRIAETSAVLLVGAGLWLTLTGFLVVGLKGGVDVAALAYGASLAGQASIMAIVARRHIGSLGRAGAPAPRFARQFISFAGRAFPGAIAHQLWQRMPVFLLNAFYGPTEVGIFSTAQQLVQRTLLPIVAMQSATYNEMSTLSRPASTSAVNSYVRFCWWGMIIVAAIGIALAGPIVQVLFSGRYQAAVPVIQVLLPGAVFSACALLLDAFFLNQLHRPGLLSALAGIQVLLCVGLGVLLIPGWGLAGAAMSLVITQVLGTLLYARWHLKCTGSRVRDLISITRSDVRTAQRGFRRLRSRGLRQG